MACHHTYVHRCGGAVHGVYFYGVLRWYNECMSVFDLHITNGLERSQISRELVALYIHRILAGAGNAIAGVFTVVFVYQYFGNSLWAALNNCCTSEVESARL